MTTATLPRQHRPARRPLTDELLAVGDAAAIRRHGIAHVRRTADDGVRDSRRILKETLAAAAHRLSHPDREYLTTCYLEAALDPTMTEERLHEEMLSVMIAGGSWPLTAEYAVEACVALLEGWAHRQRLTAGGAA